jgi:hypothetical protein
MIINYEKYEERELMKIWYALVVMARKNEAYRVSKKLIIKWLNCLQNERKWSI